MADTNPFPLTELHFNEKRLPMGVKHPAIVDAANA